MANAYTDNLRSKYTGIKTTIDGIQARAAEENRDLTADELRSISDQSEVAKKLADELGTLVEIEARDAKVAETATRATSATVAQDRDPGHYTRSSQYSFFGDLYTSKQGDENAAGRLGQHNRALSTGAGNAGAGVVPPKWMTEEFQTVAYQGRRVAGDDPRPITMPKQTAGASVAEQATENTAVSEADGWASDVATVIPKATAGIQVVSRQMLDMSNPAIDGLIYGDLLASYNEKIEAKVVAAMLASAGTAVVTLATEAEFEADAADCLVSGAIAVRSARKLPADVAIMNVGRYGEFLKLKDSTGRPLLPLDSAGPMNVLGTGSVAVDGRIHGLGVLATEGIATGYPESILVARASDTLLFESNVMRFRYEEVAGPESVKLGIWGYSAVHVKYAGDSVKSVSVTIA